MAIALRYAARSDIGLVRSTNQDSGYVGPNLLVVADGMGGHVGGDVASSLAIGELAPLDGESHGSDDALGHLSKAVHAAHRELLDRVAQEPALTGMGTTLTALLRTGHRFALAHIGDSRAYLLRDDALVQITHDHTFVQTLVDEGRLTPEEAEQHPQRSVLMRVLSDVVEDVEPDLSMREAKVGDRYLLCSDGLSGVVSLDTLRATLAAGADPASTCETLVQLALRSGAPDNVTCIVADVVDASGTPPETGPSVVGAATAIQPARTSPASTPAERAAELTAPLVPPAAVPADRPGRRRPGRALWLAAVSLGLLGVIVAGGYGAYRWSQVQFFVGASAGSVAIYRGLPQDLGPIRLSTVDQVAPDVPVDELPSYSRQRVQRGIVADGKGAASQIVQSLRDQVRACRAAAVASAQPPAPPTPTTPGTTSTGITAAAPTTVGATTPESSESRGTSGGTSHPSITATPSAATTTVTRTPTTASATAAAPSGGATPSATPFASPTGVAAVDCEGLG